VDDATVDLGLALWNTATIYPVITFEQAVTACNSGNNLVPEVRVKYAGRLRLR
jgi:hypothetical protein